MRPVLVTGNERVTGLLMAGIVGNKSAACGLSNSVNRRPQVTKTTETEEGTMNCEICKVIQKLDLRKSAHELWFCIDKAMPHRRRRVAMVERAIRRPRKLFA